MATGRMRYAHDVLPSADRGQRSWVAAPLTLQHPMLAGPSVETVVKANTVLQ